MEAINIKYEISALDLVKDKLSNPIINIMDFLIWSGPRPDEAIIDCVKKLYSKGIINKEQFIKIEELSNTLCKSIFNADKSLDELNKILDEISVIEVIKIPVIDDNKLYQERKVNK